ncbi:MAG: 5-formyltetrahydrofolate cyclo-ligase [Deltaproteobacteria bacterium]|nr:5-formyltetrahydrofolate cyclo-ligase [Deltaproteobacteria bacterium]
MLSKGESAKQNLRVRFLARREESASSFVETVGVQIQERALSVVLQKFKSPPRSVGLYSPIKNEVTTSLLFQTFRKNGSDLFYPRINRSRKKLDFFKVSGAEELQTGSFGILEPSDRGIMAEGLDLLFVPGVAFDEEGFRLGYGGGFYDRLGSVPIDLRVGLAYDFQIVSLLPRDEKDLSCDVVVTEKRIIQKGRGPLCRAK